MILNIHGLESDGNNSKYRYLIEKGYKNVQSPTLDYKNQNTYNVFNRLCNCIELSFKQNPDEQITVIGSSLGGFFAYCLCVKYGVRTLLLNPSLMPFVTLRNNDYFSGTRLMPFIKLFGEYMREAEYYNFNAILSLNDEVINHEELTLPILGSKDSSNIYFVDSDHRMAVTEEIGELIEKLIAPSTMKLADLYEDGI